MGRLSGKIAFVTGAGGGIGKAVCERFLAEDAKVFAADLDVEAAASAIAGIDPDHAKAFSCDVGDSAGMRSAIAEAVEHFGKLDVLCNIAGGSSQQDGSVTEAPEEEFWRVIRTDLFGTFLSCKYGIPELARSGGGSVINFTSMVALMALPGRDCYTAAKGGVASLTRSLALEYAHQKIRVNAIAPGITATPRVLDAIEHNDEFARLTAGLLLGPGQPIDIAHMAVYLASDESRVTTGQILQIDSGVTIH
jgi:NAD(P)-dependent dehydrogenase (short-subunit alcohol dehydrogenase family)